MQDSLTTYVDNLRFYIYGMRQFPAKVRSLFHSDMRIVVDYLAEGECYRSTEQKHLHVNEFLLMMHALSGDTRYKEMITRLETEQAE